MEDFNQNFNAQPQKDDSSSTMILAFICIILLVSNIFFGVEYFLVNAKLNKLNAIQAQNAKVSAFESLFINKVLKTQGAVGYQDRLNLQSAVVGLNDNGILGDWNTFLASTTEAQAQQSVLVLLNDFANKINK